jgi:SAM-dependent methyltransferase
MTPLGRFLRSIGRLLLLLLEAFVLMQVVLRLVRRYVKFPAPPFLSVILQSPLRRALQPPSDVIDMIDIHAGMQVVEVGPGPGTFTVEAAQRAWPGGHIYAVDIQPEMLLRLERTLRESGITNTTTHMSSAYILPVPDHSIDRLFLVTVLAEIPDKQRALAEFRRVLKPTGLLGVAEFLLDPDYPWPRTVRAWCEAAGYRPYNQAISPLHYVLTFRPEKRTVPALQPEAASVPAEG